MKLNIPKALREFTTNNIKETEEDATFLNYLNTSRKFKNFCLIKKGEEFKGREYTGVGYVHGMRKTNLEFSCTVEDKELGYINVNYIEVEVPSSIEIGIGDIPVIEQVIATTTKYGGGSGNKIPTPKIITKTAWGGMGTLAFFTHNEQTIVRKIGGTPKNVSDFLLPIVSHYEAQKEEEERRREEKECERLEMTDRRLESAKNDMLAEIKRIRNKLDSLEKEIIDAKEYSYIPDVCTSLYPEEDC